MSQSFITNRGLADAHVEFSRARQTHYGPPIARRYVACNWFLSGVILANNLQRIGETIPGAYAIIRDIGPEDPAARPEFLRGADSFLREWTKQEHTAARRSRWNKQAA